MKSSIKTSRAFSLIELMIAILIATLMSFTVISLYVNQTTQVSSESSRDNTIQEANRTFDLVSRLLRQAHKNSINIDYPGSVKANDETTPELKNDGISISFTVPHGFNIWPNDKAPFTKNTVQIKWDNNSSGDKPYVVQIANASNVGSISNFDLKEIAGDNSGQQARIVNLDIWPMADQRSLQNSVSAEANNGYLLRVTASAPKPDKSYVNPNASADSLFKHYRTHTVSGVISPRN